MHANDILWHQHQHIVCAEKNVQHQDDDDDYDDDDDRTDKEEKNVVCVSLAHSTLNLCQMNINVLWAVRSFSNQIDHCEYGMRKKETAP